LLSSSEQYYFLDWDDDSDSQLGALFYLKRWLIDTNAAKYVHFLSVLISLVSCGIYVAQTYHETHQVIPFWAWAVAEVFLSASFVVLLLVDALLSRTSISFFQNPMNILDIITILPVFSLAAWDSRRFLGIRLIMFLRTGRILKLAGLGQYI